MTDIASYLNLLFATIGRAALPAHRRADAEPDVEPDPRSDPVAAGRRRDRAARAGVQGLRRRARLRLHRGAEERLPPADHRRQAGRHLRRGRARRVDGPAHGRGGRPLRRRPQAREGDQGRRSPRRCWSATGCCRSTSSRARRKAEAERFYKGAVQRDASLRLRRHRARVLHVQQPGERLPHLRRARASHKLTHPELLVPDPRRSILGGCFVREAFKYNPDTWDGRVMYSLSQGAATSRSTRRGRSCRRRCGTRSSTASTAGRS